MNKEQNKFVKRVKSRFLFKLFTIAKLPLAFISGLKVLDLDENQCSTSVQYKYLNKNPFQSMYFAVLNMAAELSTGVLALLATKGR
ncbi:MAG TPA: thioesterase, partial [Candidatus Marinimicrobia bacterium]|nr:thioesterase [Candidatus Neomarinimicrobiota bacterium]